jgi:DNA-binding NtrC family response regulator
MKLILVVSHDRAACSVIKASLRKEYAVEVATENNKALDMFKRKRYEFLFLDVEMLPRPSLHNDVKTALQPFWQAYPTAQIIVMAPQDRIRDAVMAVKAGASDYLTYPVNPEEVRYLTESAYESLVMESELDYLRDRFWREDSIDLVRTQSPLMKDVFDKIRSVAPTKSTVLLVGETGTGKGVLAGLIHQHSNRREGSFIAVHCGAIPDTLIESELFGHEKGAFTGAVRRKLGKFEIAQGGTIFLDEVATITPTAQIKLLQVLQDGTFHRVGGEETMQANVRVVAATNMDLRQLCDQGQFRRDLYYRLNVFPIAIPPLRERTEDITHLIDVILKRLNKFQSKEIRGIDPLVLEAFRAYPWPGNIRELENLLERAHIIEKGPILSAESFPPDILQYRRGAPISIPPTAYTLAEVRRRAVEETESAYLTGLLAAKTGRVKDTAHAAGITTRQLHKLMKKYNLRKEVFKDMAT